MHGPYKPFLKMYAWTFCCLLFYLHASNANSGYLVVTPSAFRPNTEQVISVTILKPSEPVYVEAKLFSKTGSLITEAGCEIFGKGTIKLKVPRDAKGRCTLKVCGNCMSLREDVFTFYNSTIIMVEEKGASVFIQLDKPVYKPGQTVHANIISTGPDLRPVDGHLQAYLVDARGTKMIQWNDLKPLCCGIVNVSFAISKQPVLGNWTIFAKLHGETYNRTFAIQKYVLPKFEVYIEPPRFIRNWTICEPVYVHARYTFGRPVKGVLSVTATVHGAGYYKDYKGLTTARVLPIDGVANISVCVDELTKQPVSEHFRGALHVEAEVISEDGEQRVTASDSTCAVNRHLIELQFTKDTRKHFKPGLPFKGQLLVYYPDGSPANNVTVRIRADVSGRKEALSLEEFVSSDGLIRFKIPALPLLAQSVWVDAKVLQIESEYVGDRYMPLYHSISSWYSPSQCHVLVEPRTNDLKAGDEARFLVYSTCTCNFTMFYEVMARGTIVHSGIHFARHVQRHRRGIKFAEVIDLVKFDNDMTQEQVGRGIKICTIYLKFLINYQMAPFSRLLVYYIRDNGEGVADSLMFKVQPGYKNKITLETSKKQLQPGDPVTLNVDTNQGSCVCVGAVDKSVHLLRPDYQLSTEEIFEELETYDLTIEEEDTPSRHWSVGSWVATGHASKQSRRKRSTFFWQQTTSSRDALYAFEESGMLVMTDRVGLHYRQEILTHGPNTPSNPHQVASFAISQRDTRWQQKSRSRKRSFFPETWIWTCFNSSSTHQISEMVVASPDTITTWVLSGISMSPQHGLALASPVEVTTFKKFFVSFNLPFSLIRGEQAKVPITIHNYLDYCVQVHVKVLVSAGVHVGGLARDGGSEMGTHKACVAAGEKHFLTTVFIFTKLGDVDISAEAQAYASPNSLCCSVDIGGENTISEQHLVGSDTLVRKLKVEPEGTERRYTHSVFFCPNERIHVSTGNKYEFQYLPKPESFANFTLAVRASNDVRVALSTQPEDNDEMYVVVIGGWSNMQSWIAQGSHEDNHLVNVSTRNVVSEDESRKFWLSWRDGHIKVGYGEDMMRNGSLMMSVITNKSLIVKFIGFSTGWGSRGEFSVWRQADVDGTGYGEVFHLGIPANSVEGSQRATARIIGDVIGPAIHNVQSLLLLPSGCGEQNMINFAPNVYLLNYLNRTRQLNDKMEQKLLGLLTKSLQRQMTYRREDGSYSAFGDRDASGSMWLTAFVVKSYAQAKHFMYVDDEEISNSVKWIIGHQRENGRFPAIGRLINKQLQSGAHSGVTLTAYVAIALLECGVNTKLEEASLSSARGYLEKHVHLVSDPYTMALSAYALSSLQSDFVFKPFRRLKDMAVRQDGFMYWILSDDTSEEDLFSTGKLVASSAEIETASYALLTLTSMQDVAGSLPIVKWLSQQRNGLGGFSSTQDTCVALQALTAYAGAAYRGAANMSVTVASTNMDLQHVFDLNANTSELLQEVAVPSLPTGLFVSADGEGCALLQIDVSYNVVNSSKHRAAFALSLRLRTSQLRSKRSADPVTADSNNDTKYYENSKPLMVTMEACAKWLRAGTSNMAVLEVTLLSGMRPELASLDRLLQQKHLQLKRYEVEEQKIFFYFDEIQSTCRTCLSFETYQEHIVRKTHPATIRVYDYYEPELETTVFYNASHLSQFTADLCIDDTCEQLNADSDISDDAESSAIFSCQDDTLKMALLCRCHDDCRPDDQPICASDGVVYDSRCHMDVAACNMDKRLDVMSITYCNHEEDGHHIGTNQEDLHGESSSEHLRKQQNKMVQPSVVEQSTTNKSLRSKVLWDASHYFFGDDPNHPAEDEETEEVMDTMP